MIHHSLHILTNQVELNIHQGFWKKVPNIGIIICIGNDGNRKSIVRYIKACQADPVNSDGSFFYDEVPEGFREFETENPASFQVFTKYTFCRTVHMPLDH